MHLFGHGFRSGNTGILATDLLSVSIVFWGLLGSGNRWILETEYHLFLLYYGTSGKWQQGIARKDEEEGKNPALRAATQTTFPSSLQHCPKPRKIEYSKGFMAGYNFLKTNILFKRGLIQ